MQQLRIGKAPLDDKRLKVAFLNRSTRTKLEIELNEKDRVLLKGKRNIILKKKILLPIESDKICKDNQIHINKKLRIILGISEENQFVEVIKAGFITKVIFSIKTHSFGYIISFLLGFLANWAWSLFS